MAPVGGIIVVKSTMPPASVFSLVRQNSERFPNDESRLYSYHGACPSAEAFWSTQDSRKGKGLSMTDVFRKHYSYGETIPIIDTQVGMITDIYEVVGRPGPSGPAIKAVCTALAGPMKSIPIVVDTLQGSDSKVVHLTNIPVPIAWVKTIDMSLIFDFVNYRFTPAPETPRENGLVTFDLRLRAAFSVLGKSYTLQLDQRPCTITLTKTLPQLQMAQFGTLPGFESQQQQFVSQQSGQSERGSMPYGRSEHYAQPPADGGGTEPSALVTNQLDIEERLRQLGTKLLAHS